MSKYKSTVPGMIYPSTRDNLLKSGINYLAGRQNDDGAEGLWRIRDELYDLENFIKNHPGGPEWLELTRGTDITEAFEVHHITGKAELMLDKFYVRQAAVPRSLGYTFHPNGFYRKFKERVREALKNVDIHNPALHSKLIADSILVATILSLIGTAILKSWLLIPVSGLFLAWTVVISHNFLHMRDNFRLYYMDLSLVSSKEWRISHALSHHLYPNTVWDCEVSFVEPFVSFLPYQKSLPLRLLSLLLTPFVYSLGLFFFGFKRYYFLYNQETHPDFRDLVPWLLPALLSICALSIFEGVKLWLCIILFASFFFHFIGLTAAHHHPDLFHDGDICRSNVDWGLMELDATRDREVIDDSVFLALTNFGSHVLHHLLPTIDHAYLSLCEPALRDTCAEFGIPYARLTHWDLVKGQFQQLMRAEPRANFLIAKNEGSRST